MQKFPFITATFALMFISGRVLAMNWEGHEDWLENQSHAGILRSVLPPPLRTTMPNCQARHEMGENNPYEQRPLPGENCRNEDDTTIRD